MGPREEEQLRVEQRIQQEEPVPDTPRQVVMGIVGMLILFGLPAIIDWIATGRRPGR